MINEGSLARTLTGGYVRILLDENDNFMGIRWASSSEADKLTKEEIKRLPLVTLGGNILESRKLQ